MAVQGLEERQKLFEENYKNEKKEIHELLMQAQGQRKILKQVTQLELSPDEINQLIRDRTEDHKVGSVLADEQE